MLETLYREYKELNDKLQKIKDLIVMYGGVIPGYEDNTCPPPQLGVITDHPLYPREGTLREKLLFVIKSFDKPVTIAEIYDKLLSLEPSLRATSKNLRATVGQYCSAMKDLELIADTSEFRHKYSYNPNYKPK